MPSSATDAPSLPGLEALLGPLPDEVGTIARAIVAQLARTPGLIGAVKPGWRSVNFRHARAGHVCAVFPYQDTVAVYFENGRLLDDPEGLLEGAELKKGRVLRLRPGAAIPEAAIAVFVAEAIALSER